MAKEIKVGIFSIIAIVILVVGYQYLKGINIFNASTNYHVYYDDVDFLEKSDPVLLNGMQVGIVSNIQLAQDDLGKVKVTLNLPNAIRLPKNTTADIVSSGLMGGKAIKLIAKGNCSGVDCAQEGDFFEGRKQGMLQMMFGGDNGTKRSSPAEMIKGQMGSFIDTFASHISDPQAQHAIAQSFRRLEGILSNLEKTTAKLDKMMQQSSSKISGSLTHFETLSEDLAKNNVKLGAVIDNFDVFSRNLKNADIAGVARNSNQVLVQSKDMISVLQSSLDQAGKSFENLDKILEEVHQGEGTMAQLFNDKSLYVNLERLTKNLDLLLQDLRLNPKRYVNVSVFGKKQKDYRLPDSDPAFKK